MAVTEAASKNGETLHQEDLELLRREVAKYAGDEYFEDLRRQCSASYDGALPSMQAVRMFWHAECGRLTGGDRAMRKSRHSMGTSRPNSGDNGWGQPNEVLVEAARMIALNEGHGLALQDKLTQFTNWSSESESRLQSTLGVQVDKGHVIAVMEGSPAFFCDHIRNGCIVRSVNKEPVSTSDENPRAFQAHSPSGEVVTLEVAQSENEVGEPIQLFRADHDDIQQQQIVLKAMRDLDEAANKAGSEELKQVTKTCKDLVLAALKSSFSSQLSLRSRNQALQEDCLHQLEQMQANTHAVNMTVFHRLDDFRVIGNSDLESLETDAKRYKADIEMLSSQLATAQEALHRNEQELRTAQGELASCRQMMGVEDQTVKEMSALVATLKEERDFLSSKLKASHEDLVDVQTTISPLTKSKTWLEAQVDNLKTKVKSLEKVKADSLRDLNDTKETFKAASDENEEKLAALKRQMEREAQERRTGSTENKELLDRLRQAETDADVRAGQIESLRARLKENFIRVSNESIADEGQSPPNESTAAKPDWVVQHLRKALPKSKDQGTQTNGKPQSRSSSFSGRIMQADKTDKAAGGGFSSSMRKLSVDKGKLEQIVADQLSALKSAAIEATGKVKALEAENEVLRQQLNDRKAQTKAWEVHLGAEDDVCGVGIVVEAPEGEWDEDEDVVIKSVTPGGSADRSGCVEAGDRLLEVGGVSVQGKSLAQLSELVVGPAGTSVHVLLRSAVTQQPVALSLVRGTGLQPRAPLSEVRGGLLEECRSCRNLFVRGEADGAPPPEDQASGSRDAAWSSPPSSAAAADATAASPEVTRDADRASRRVSFSLAGRQGGSRLPLCSVCESIRVAELEVRRCLGQHASTGAPTSSGAKASERGAPLWTDDGAPVAERIERMVEIVCSVAKEPEEGARVTPESRPVSFPSVSEDDGEPQEMRQQLAVMRLTEQLERAQERVVELSVAVGRAEERREAEGKRGSERLALAEAENAKLSAELQLGAERRRERQGSAGGGPGDADAEWELRQRVRELESALAEMVVVQADRERARGQSSPGVDAQELEEVQRRLGELEAQCEALLALNAELKQSNAAMAAREAKLQRQGGSALQEQGGSGEGSAASGNGERSASGAERDAAQREAEFLFFRLERSAAELERALAMLLVGGREAREREVQKERSRASLVNSAADVETKLEASLRKVRAMES